jgi:hypothetical protein
MRKYWTKEEAEELQRLYPTTTGKDLALRFGCNVQQIYNRANKMGLHKDLDFLHQYYRKNFKGHKATQFKKGMKSWNKGQKGLQIGGVETQFKKGRLPHNTKPIGYRSMRDGYWVERTEKGFEFVHVLIWKQHYGDIPKGLFVVFKDRNQQNIVIENLELINRAENMRRNSVQNLPKEILEVIHIKKSITRKINQIEKNGTK